MRMGKNPTTFGKKPHLSRHTAVRRLDVVLRVGALRRKAHRDKDGVLFFPESGVVFSHTHFSAFLCIHMYFCAFYCIFKALGRAAFYKSVTF